MTFPPFDEFAAELSKNLGSDNRLEAVTPVVSDAVDWIYQPVAK